MTCTGASLLGCHARFLTKKLLDKPLPSRRETASEDDGISTSTINPKAQDSLRPSSQALSGMVQIFLQAEREGRQLTKAETRQLRAMYRKSQPQRSPLKEPGLIAEQAARLHFLCHLLVRDLRPFCAVNGVLLLIPFAGSDSDQDAAFTAETLQRDLAVMRAALKVDCPHIALVCDVETAFGFSEFLQRFPPRERLRRLGQSCPLNPELGETAGEVTKERAAQMLESLAEWICQSVVQNWVYRTFQVEKADTPDRAVLVRGNGRLFLLADELHERSKRLGTVLSRGLAQRAAAGPLLFGGCYIAAPAAILRGASIRPRRPGPLGRGTVLRVLDP